MKTRTCSIMKTTLPVLAAAVFSGTALAETCDCDGVLLYDNGFPTGVNGSASGGNGTFQSLDDYTLAEDSQVNDIHYYALDDPAGIGWDGTVRVEVWTDTDADNIPDTLVYGQTAGEGGDGPKVARTLVLEAGPFGFNRVRYDITCLKIGAQAGEQYWLSLMPGSDGSGGQSFWETAATTLEGGTINGDPSVVGDVGGPFAEAFTETGPNGEDNPSDLNFQLTTCADQGCPEDLSGDGLVDTIDLLALLGGWGACEGCTANVGPFCEGDLNKDCIVDTIDLLALLGAWGICDDPIFNDECDAATLLPGSGVYAYSLANATQSPEDQNCAAGNDVWFCAKAECDGLLNVSVDGTASVELYTIDGDGCNGDITFANCDGSVEVSAGDHVKIRLIDGGDTGESGNLTVSCELPPPGGGTCAQAVEVDIDGDAFVFDLRDDEFAGGAADALACAGSPAIIGGVAWVTFVGDGTQLTVEACPEPLEGSPLIVTDLAMRIYCNDCGTLSCVAVGDDGLNPCQGPIGPPVGATATFCSAPGVTYKVAIFAKDPGNGMPDGPGELRVTSGGSECGDPDGDCLVVGDACENKDTAGCHIPDQSGGGGLVGATSDRGGGFQVADNFAAEESGTITTVCWWSIAVDFGGPTDCAPGGTPNIQIRFFEDNGAGLPDDATAVLFDLGENVTKVASGNVVPSGIGDLVELEWSADLPDGGYSVTAGNCYWMEITDDDGTTCRHLWEATDDVGGDNTYAQVGAGAAYAPGATAGNEADMSWCVDVATSSAAPPCSSESGFTPVICTVSDYVAVTNLQTAPFSEDGGNDLTQWLADNFTPVGDKGGSQTITSICWWGSYGAIAGFTCDDDGTNTESDFIFAVYVDNGAGAPDPAQQVGLVNFAASDVTRVETSEGSLRYEYTADLTTVGTGGGISVDNGVNYFWTIVGQTGAGAQCGFLPDNTDEGNGAAAFSLDGGASWSASSGFGDLAIAMNIDAVGAPDSGKPPANDDCGNAEAIEAGITSADTSAATTDGPENPDGTCNDFGETQTHNDVWFSYTTSGGASNLIVSTCEDITVDGETGSANYDTDLVLYEGNSCDPGDLAANFVACNDDDPTFDCGTTDFHSLINVGVSANTKYLIRLGGWMLRVLARRTCW